MTEKTISMVPKAEKAMWMSLPQFIVVNVGIAIVITGITFLINFDYYSQPDKTFELLRDFGFSFIFSSALSFGGSKVDLYFDQRVSWIHEPAKRLILSISTYMVYTFIASYIIVFCLALWTGQFSLDDIPWAGIGAGTKSPMIFALIFMGIFTTRSWLLEWKKSAIEAEKLRTEKVSSQYQSLKSQLNPHFLFNSLNVLSNLVYEDADKSASFIQKLSLIYRYVLEVQQEELISLEKELSFAQNYLELQKLRFEDNLVYSIKVEDRTKGQIPPLSLQLLLENAIKHNIASKEQPLYIEIYQDEKDLIVSNSYQPKRSQVIDSTGIGLKNIELRYDFLSSRKPIIVQTDNEFVVRLPLLEMEP